MPEISNGIIDDHPSWMNKEFFETALNSGENDPNVIVTSVEVKRATAPGDNYLSQMYRAIVKMTRKVLPEERSLIIKTFPSGDSMLQFVEKAEIFDQEIKTLRDVTPAMYRLLEEASPGQYQPFSANFISSHKGQAGSVIVLEDLKTKGFEMAERTAGLDMDHCLLVMRTLGRFHATSVVLNERQKELIQPYMESKVFSVMTEEFSNAFDDIIKVIVKEVETWPGNEKRFAKSINKLSESAVSVWNEGRLRDEEEFNVLSHGDLWVNNMMFRYSSDRQKVEDVRFLDYQLCYWASPAVDLHYFLNSSTTLDLIDKHHILIEEYHRTLGETLSLLGFGHLQPSLEQINKQLEKRGTNATMSVLTIRSSVLVDRNNVPDFNEIIKGNKEFSVSDLYIESLKKQLPMLEEKGWLNF